MHMPSKELVPFSSMLLLPLLLLLLLLLLLPGADLQTQMQVMRNSSSEVVEESLQLEHGIISRCLRQCCTSQHCP